MNEQTCLSDLLEKGIAKMHELHLAQITGEPFLMGEDGLIGCCALGAIALGMGFMPHKNDVPQTDRVIDIIYNECGVICDDSNILQDGYQVMISEVVYQMNDGAGIWHDNPLSLPEILAWLKEQGL